MTHETLITRAERQAREWIETQAPELAPEARDEFVNGYVELIDDLPALRYPDEASPTPAEFASDSGLI